VRGGADSQPATMGRVVTKRRIFPISRVRLFDLWTDPQHLAAWWGPVGWRVTRCQVDLREEGRWRTWLLTSTGVDREIGGRYLEILRPERLAFTWEFPGEPGSAEQVTIVTVQFIDMGKHTELVLEHRKLSTGQAVDMDVGWMSAFDSLAAYVDRQPYEN
jgi:uncharacterized protein YndB with AHSA1/START domain